MKILKAFEKFSDQQRYIESNRSIKFQKKNLVSENLGLEPKRILLLLKLKT